MVTNILEEHNDSISTLKMEATDFSEILVRPTKIHGIKATVVINFKSYDMLFPTKSTINELI